jgi:hypothetical protein
MRIRAAGTEQCLREATRQQCLANMFRPSQQVGVAHLFCDQYTAQQIDGVFMADDVPALRVRLLRYHRYIVSKTPREGKNPYFVGSNLLLSGGIVLRVARCELVLCVKK